MHTSRDACSSLGRAARAHTMYVCRRCQRELPLEAFVHARRAPHAARYTRAGVGVAGVGVHARRAPHAACYTRAKRALHARYTYGPLNARYM